MDRWWPAQGVRTRRWLACAALLGTLAVQACGGDDVSLGSDRLESLQQGDGDGDGSGDGTADDGGPSGGNSGNGAAGTGGDGAPGSSDTGTEGPSAGDGTGNDGSGVGDGSDPASGGDGDDGGSGAGADQTCGSRGLSPCPQGQFCNHPISAACGATDIPGVCELVPDACITQVDPVCGCDGNDYGSPCEAARAGVSVRAEGTCDGSGLPGSGQNCGGFAGFACPDGEYCDYSAGDGCAIADGFGVCTTMPMACSRDLRPACGCDGKTYSNPCAAASAGVSVAYLGECNPDAKGLCGGGQVCGAGQYCSGTTSNTCGAPDGVCLEGATACNLIFAPVCGCDGVEYGNACEAAAAGAGVAQTGGC